MQSRRRFLATLSSAACAGIAGMPGPGKAEPPPETLVIRMEKSPGGICVAPEYLVGDMLRAEGFDNFAYVPVQSADLTKGIARGEADFCLTYVPTFVASIDAGVPITVLAGVHPGCFELFAN